MLARALRVHSVVVITGLTLAAVLPAQSAEPPFVPMSGPSSMAGPMQVADLDGDGHPDVVAGVPGQTMYAVFLNDGFGHLAFGFQDPVYPSGYVQALALADFTGDGKVDVLTLDSNPSGIGMHPNLGDATFGSATAIAMGTSPRDVIAADLDGDGTLDAVVATGAGEIAIRRGLAGGAFDALQSIPVGGELRSVDAGDLDHDGKVDLVVVDHASNRLLPYRNLGGFVFQAGTPQAVGQGPSDVKLADLDGDGWLDAAVANEDATVAVLTNGSGIFGVASFFPVGHMSQSVEVADFDLDGILDLLVSNRTEGTVQVLTGLGGMQFSPGAGHVTYAAPIAAVAADFDGDGRPDVLAGSTTAFPPGGSSATTQWHLAGPGPRIDRKAWSIDYGSGFTGQSELGGVTIRNIGGASLEVTATTSAGQFTVVAPAGTGSASSLGGLLDVKVSFARSADGTFDDTLHVATNDPFTPAIAVPLHGVAVPPPVAVVSAPPHASVAAGAQGSTPIRIRNLGGGPLHLTMQCDPGDLAESSALDGGPTTAPFLRADVDGGWWDIAFDGTVGVGTNDAYHGGMRLTGFPLEAGGILGVGGRELRVGPFVTNEGLQVTRKVYVSPSLGYARWVDVAENPGEETVTWSNALRDTIGFAQVAPIRTSSGDAQFTNADDWLVIPPDDLPGRRAVGRVVRTVNGSSSGTPTLAMYAQTPQLKAYSRTNFEVSVPAHGRTAIVQWAIQGTDANAAVAIAQALRQSPAEAYEHMDAIDRATAANTDSSAFLVRAVPSTQTVPPHDSLDIALILNGTISSHASEISGTFRIATDDPDHPAFQVPFSYSVTGGAVVGTPGAAGSGAVLTLAGLVPNPSLQAGAPRIAYSLASDARASLTVYDVRGRRIASQAIERPVPGPGTIVLANRLAPGVIWLRLEQGGRVATSKGVVLP